MYQSHDFYWHIDYNFSITTCLSISIKVNRKNGVCESHYLINQVIFDWNAT